ncbi:uncharacterized protein LOC126824978 [Patella vulgata]|uniref:uncharacterized protein LOC126824978 n=1 Tax=Patella vulgata TaxID=6465 RepID=UPI0024A91F0F|nr:uncharacterized protein LOC126824978 [Patella vulgata]
MFPSISILKSCNKNNKILVAKLRLLREESYEGYISEEEYQGRLANLRKLAKQKKLANLRNKGIISEEAYQRLLVNLRNKGIIREEEYQSEYRRQTYIISTLNN